MGRVCEGKDRSGNISQTWCKKISKIAKRLLPKVKSPSKTRCKKSKRTCNE